MYVALLAFVLGGFLWSCAVHAVRWIVDRNYHPSFIDSVYLGFGIKLAAAAILLFLGGLPAPIVLALVFFVAWAILARYGKLSEFQALSAVGLLIGIELIWMGLA